MKYIINIFIVLLFSYLFFFCSDTGVSPDQANYVIPDKDVSYYRDLQPMFNGKCGFGSNCHSGENPYNALFFNSKEGFMNYTISFNGDPLIDLAKDQENPDNSTILNLLKGTYATFTLPHPSEYNREPLNSNQINGIKIWISEGCKD